ncbi:MAG TPA: GAF domain-containing protein, partial [Candidatus Ozemobacteraceae bacterium]|nr:GAF domain-containing protein [Candidatus Ozemobacteraceae bacterium]
MTGIEIDAQQQVLRYEYVLKALSDIGDELCRVTSFDAQLKSLLHLLLGTLGVSKGGIFLYDAMSGSLSLKCSWKLSKKAATCQLSPEEAHDIEKQNDPITFAIPEFPFIKDLIAGFKDDDLNSISILKVREKLIGFLVIGHKLKREPFSEKEASFLTTLSRNISVAINNFLLMADLRDTNKRLDDKIQEVSILYQATQMIASELQLQTLLDMAMSATSEISEVKRGSIWLYDEEHDTFTLRSHLGDTTDIPDTIPINKSQVCQFLFNNKEPIIKIRDVDASMPLPEIDQSVFENSFVIVPIIHQG